MNASKRKGTGWETSVVDYLRSRGWSFAERRALSGGRDRGDVAGLPGVVIECKAARALDLAGWTAEAEIERANDRADLGAVWVKRRGKTSPAAGYVVLDGATFARLLTLAGYGGATDDQEAAS